MSNSVDPPVLKWSERDIEQRFFLGMAEPFTQVNSIPTGILALLLTILLFAFLTFVVTPLTSATRTEVAKSESAENASPSQLVVWIGWMNDMLTLRGPTQHATVFLAFWSILILAIKSQKLGLQRMALCEDYRIVPSDPGFVVAAGTVDLVLRRLHEVVDDPRHFIVFNRIAIALSNLKNLGRVSDVDDVLRSQAENDESSTETSYSVVAGFVWAIPVLGFIGTVLGLSQAIGQFGDILKQSSDMEKIKEGLKGVTNGLSTAFETTLLALVAALAIQLWVVFLKKSEQRFLDECSEYCLRNVVSRLRMSTYEDERT
jgi:hypothetical protein